MGIKIKMPKVKMPSTKDIGNAFNDAGKVIHVGILLSKDEIIHASAYVRIDLFTENGIFSKDYNKITHQLATIKRV